MKPRTIKPLSKAELEKLSTPRVLAYLKKLQRCEESIQMSDFSESELTNVEGIVFKSSPQWQAQYDFVKLLWLVERMYEKGLQKLFIYC